MKNNKIILFLMIFIFITAIFSANLFLHNDGTSLNNVRNQTDKISEKYTLIKKSNELLAEQLEKIPEAIEVSNKTITIAVTGDIMFHTTQLKSAFDNETKTYDFYPMFQKIEKYISSADLAIANLETVVDDVQGRYSGYPRFNSPVETLMAIRDVGFDILSTANNHCLDKGKNGIINTIDNINEYGMENIGTYKDSNKEVMIKDVDGIKIGILSYTYGCNGLKSLLTKEELSYMVNIIDEHKMKMDIEQAKALEADIILVCIHWGNEYQTVPSEEQKLLGKKMIDWGADIILGSHPHVIQRSELIEHEGKRKFIVYSMGNFISNQRRETLSNRNKKYTEDGVIIRFMIEKDYQENETIIKDIEYVPTWVNRYLQSGKLKYEILPTNEYINKSEEDLVELSKEVMSKIEESYHETMKKMSQ